MRATGDRVCVRRRQPRSSPRHCRSSCGCIINELVTNALKYAFPDGRAGRIRVAFNRRHAIFVLAVEDDGGGMAGAVQGGGAGLPLLNGLARSLNGKFDVNSGPAGTRAVRPAFPSPNPSRAGNRAHPGSSALSNSGGSASARMSAQGQKRTFDRVAAYVCFGPAADIALWAKQRTFATLVPETSPRPEWPLSAQCTLGISLKG